MQPEVLNNSKY